MELEEIVVFFSYKHLRHKCEIDRMNVKCALVLRFVE